MALATDLGDDIAASSSMPEELPPESDDHSTCPSTTSSMPSLITPAEESKLDARNHHCASASLLQDPQKRTLQNCKLNDFIWTSSPQPHAVRRRHILQKYPEIERLYGNDVAQAMTAFVTIGLQLYFAYVVSSVVVPWWVYALCVTLVSATLNHSLFAAMHEGSHKTIFSSKLASELFCMATTIPMAIPASIPFKRYHLDHHIYQGVTHMDPDLPTAAEAWFFDTAFKKLIWVMLLPATYSLRPMITRPKPVVMMDVFNWILILSLDGLILHYWGLKAFLYLLLGTFFSMNFHPFAGHFISEHYIMPNSDMYQETSSYYGWGNILTYNVGYHNEHHDFPRVPGSRLPLVTKIAHEFYDIPHHPSWWKVTWDFILTPHITPWNRVTRIATIGGDPSKNSPHKCLHKGIYPFGGPKCFWPKIGSSF